MNIVTSKEGVQFAMIAPAGFAILSAIYQASQALAVDLVITSGTDGCHSGQVDPHHSGEAYDVRSQNLTPDQKNSMLLGVMGMLGWDHFYGFLEDPGTENEHFHFQRKKGTVYPPQGETT